MERSLIVFGIIIAMFATTVFGIANCPIGFRPLARLDSKEIDQDHDLCWKIKSPEIQSYKYKDCLGNRVPLNLSTLAEDPELLEAGLKADLLWSDYIRFYDGGPFMQWRVDRDQMGHPNLNINFTQNPDLGCAAFRFSTGKYEMQDCNKKLFRVCLVKINEDIDSTNCYPDYVRFFNPIPTCILASVLSSTERNVSTRLNFIQAERNCSRNQGYLLSKGYIYANQPPFNVKDKELPLGIKRSENDFLWMDSSEMISRDDWNFSPGEDFNVSYPNVLLRDERWWLTSNAHVYNNVLCEHLMEPLIVMELRLEYNDLYLLTDIPKESIACFTDSITYYPVNAIFDKKIGGDDRYIVEAPRSGHYWCMAVNYTFYYPDESEKVLFLKDEEDDLYQYTVVVEVDDSVDKKTLGPFLDSVEKQIDSYIWTNVNSSTTIVDSKIKHSVDSRTSKSIADSDFYESHFKDLISDFLKTDKIYQEILDRPMVFKNSSLFKILAIKRINGNGVWNNFNFTLTAVILSSKRDEIHHFISKRSPISFEGFKLVEMQNNRYCNEVELHLNDTGTEFRKFKLDDTVLLENCTTFMCTGNYDDGLHWKKMNDLKNCIVTTTTMRPSEQVTELANTLQIIANSSSINTTQLQTISMEVSKVLDFGSGVEIPKTILEDLDKIVNKVEMPENETQVKIVQPNLGIIVAKKTESTPIAGFRVEKIINGFENNSINTFDSGEMNQIMTNASGIDVIVNIASVMETNNYSRFSFLVFKNDYAFSHGAMNNSNVNSRVISVSVGNDTLFEKEEYIDIYLRPYRGELPRNESKLCVFWDFNLGTNGNWSTEGCQLLQKTSSSDFDTCRCTHLTHFAEIIRFNGNVGDADEIALSIISYIGCSFSLLGLFVIGLTGTLFKAWRNEFSNKIWLHLSGAVMLLILTFLTISIVKFDDQNKGLCVFFAVSLHYSLLASFCWMLISALLSYQRLVTVFSKNSSHRLLKSCLFGWLAPLLPIILLFSISNNPYPGHWEIANIQRKFCFPDGIGFWLSIFMPVVLIVMMNSFLFIVIIYSVFINTNIQRHGDAKQLYRSLTVSFLLFFLFGISWVFGLFMDHIILTYIFCITTTIQGFILFIFFVLGNKKTREMWCVSLGIQNKKLVTVTSSASTNKRSVSNEKNVPLRNMNKPRSMTGNANNIDARFS